MNARNAVKLIRDRQTLLVLRDHLGIITQQLINDANVVEGGGFVRAIANLKINLQNFLPGLQRLFKLANIELLKPLLQLLVSSLLLSAVHQGLLGLLEPFKPPGL